MPEKKRSTSPCASTAFFFDHNLHALRIVEDFELRYAAFRGLNLTFEVREGIIKHSHDYPAGRFPELAEYLLELRPPLEAQLIDVADEIAYSTADIDDGYESHLLELKQIRNGIAIFERFYGEVESIYPDAIDKLKFNETLKRMLNHWVGDLIENTKEEIRRAGVKNLEDVRSCQNRLVTLSSPAEQERREAKDFLYKNLYFSATLDPEKNDAERVISELFHFWMAKPACLPSSYKEKATQEPLPRIVCDYIAGMTDNYIYEQYEKYCG